MLLLAWRGVRHNTGRYVATLIAILTGVSFFAASGFLGDRVVDSLEGDTRAQFGAVELAVIAQEDDEALFSSETLRLPGEVADRVTSVDGVDGFALLLSGEVAVRTPSGDVAAEGATGRLWIGDEQLNPLELIEGRGPSVEGEVAIDRGLADDLDLTIGDVTTVLSIAGANQVAVVGITAFGDSDSIDSGGTISIPSAVAPAWLAAGTVEYDGLYLRGSAEQQDLLDRVEPLLPAGFEAKTGDAFLQDKIDELGEIGRF